MVERKSRHGLAWVGQSASCAQRAGARGMARSRKHLHGQARPRYVALMEQPSISGVSAPLPCLAFHVQARRRGPRCSTPSWHPTWPPAPSSTPTPSIRQARVGQAWQAFAHSRPVCWPCSSTWKSHRMTSLAPPSDLCYRCGGAIGTSLAEPSHHLLLLVRCRTRCWRCPYGTHRAASGGPWR